MEKKSNNSKSAGIIRAWKLLYVLLISGMFWGCWMLYYLPQMKDIYYWRGNLVLFLAYALFSAYMLSRFEGFNLGVFRNRDVMYSQAVALTVSDFAAYVIIFLLIEKLPEVVHLLALLVLQLVVSSVWIYVGNRIYFSLYKPKKTVIVYENESEVEKIKNTPYFENKFQVLEEIKYAEKTEDFSGIISENAECVFVTGIDAESRNKLIQYCLRNGLYCCSLPNLGDIILAGAVTDCLNGEVVMNTQRKIINPDYALVKRAFDIIASLLGLLLLSPLLIVISFMIAAYDNGPVIYKQIRLTKDGREFMLWKFRSMRVDAEKDGIARLAAEDDDRITPVGKFIRKCRIDELPQLVNILKGDMSLVGPRPERPEIAEQYEEKLPEFRLRLQVKAGLTGYAQVYGKYNTEPYEKLQMDLLYINKMSLLEDAKLIFTTIKILFKKESTEGINPDQITAMSDK